MKTEVNQDLLKLFDSYKSRMGISQFEAAALLTFADILLRCSPEIVSEMKALNWTIKDKEFVTVYPMGVGPHDA